MSIKRSIKRGNAEKYYPPGVIAAGAQVAYNTKATSGLQSTPLYNPVSNAGLLPSGTNIISGPNEVQFPTSSSGSWVIEDFDFTGYEVSSRGGTVEFRRCKFANNGGGRLLRVADDTTVIAKNCTFDGTGLQSVNHGIVLVDGAGTFKEYDCYHDKTPKCHVDVWGYHECYRCYFGSFGHNPGVGPHMEGIFYRQHTGHIVEDCYSSVIDYDAPSGETGLVYVEGEYNTTGVTFTRCIFEGAANNSIAYPLQFAAKNANVTIVMNNCAIGNGTSGYIGYTEQNGKVVTSSGSNNFDIDTAAEVSVAH